MDQLVVDRLEEVRSLCRRFDVGTLELFGSATTGAFDPSRSDLDFLVDWLPESPVGKSDRFFGVLFGLEDLFNRRVDLLEKPAVKNARLAERIFAEAEAIYVA